MKSSARLFFCAFLSMALTLAPAGKGFALAPTSPFARHEDYPRNLPIMLNALLQDIFGTEVSLPVNVRTWEEQRQAIGEVLIKVGPSLVEKQETGLLRLLTYCGGLRSDEGYRYELDFLAGQMQKEKGQVPAVFKEAPMQDKEYVLLKVEATGYNDSGEDRITEITATRYRGLQKLGEFRTLVNPQKEIPDWMAQKVGITQAMVADAPMFAAVADKLKEFIGDAPLVMHFSKFHMTLLDKEFERAGQGPLLNEVIDTVDESHKVFPTLKRHNMATLWGHLGFVADEEPRGTAYTRMHHWVLQHIALEQKQRPESRFYEHFLKRFAVSSEITSARYFEQLKQKFGARVESVRSWKEIIPYVQQMGIKRIFLDFDMTVFRNKGYYASDIHVSKRLAMEGPRELIVNEYIAGDNFLTGELDFIEMMEQEIPDVLKALQAMGVEIIVWTARGTNPGEREKVLGKFQKIGVTLNQVILCDGRKKEGMQAFYDTVEKGDNSQRVPTLVIDDSSSNIRKVMEDAYLGHQLHALQARFENEGRMHVFCWDFMERGRQFLKQAGDVAGNQDETARRMMDSALACFYNAYRAALDKETPGTIVKVQAAIYQATEDYAAQPKVRSLWVRLKEKDLARQLSQMAMPEADRIRFGNLLPSIIDAIPKIDPDIRVPTLVDVMAWAQKDRVARSEELKALIPTLNAGGFILPLGDFEKVWEYSLALAEIDAGLANKIHWPWEFMRNTIPEFFRARQAMLMPWSQCMPLLEAAA